MFPTVTEEMVQQALQSAQYNQKRAEKLAELAELDKKRAEKLAEIAKIDSGVMSEEETPAPHRVPTTTTATTDGMPTPKRRGRPPKIKDGTAPTITKPTKPKQPSLEAVIAGLVLRHKGGLELSELVVKVLQTGYKSDSDDFSNMVAQAVTRLIKKSVIRRDADTMRYFSEAA